MSTQTQGAVLFAIKLYGKDYEVDSLRTMLAALDTVLRENQKPSNILVDKDFCRESQGAQWKGPQRSCQGKEASQV